MSLSLRTWAELLGSAAMAILVGWLLLSRAHLQTDLANQKVVTRTQQLKTQAAEVSSRSCTAALDRVQMATGALVQATESANRLTGEALRRAQDRTPVVRVDMDRLLGVRAAPGLDCETAMGLAQAAWFEGQ